MTQHPPEDPTEAFRAFAIDGELLRYERLKRGHIHDTYVSTWSCSETERRYLHQRVNTAVFKDVAGLMHNVARLTRHMRETANTTNSELIGLDLVAVRDGRDYLVLPDGAWRTYHYVPNTLTFDRPENATMAFEAARAFGDFLARLESLPASDLCETIPRFFSSPYRLEQLNDAREADVVGRALDVRPELAFVEARRKLVPQMEEGLASGRIPSRVIHGDTKLNNVLFDATTRHPRCIVDLDTCMPGFALYDFGDLVRFTACTAREDEAELARVDVDLALYEALAKGYIAGAGSTLSSYERSLMPEAARLVTLTIGMRFLADHLAGDKYFKIDRKDHNLARAKVQFALVEALERRLGLPV